MGPCYVRNFCTFLRMFASGIARETGLCAHCVIAAFAATISMYLPLLYLVHYSPVWNALEDNLPFLYPVNFVSLFCPRPLSTNLCLPSPVSNSLVCAQLNDWRTVPIAWIKRLENHSLTKKCTLFWTIIKPLETSGVQDSDSLVEGDSDIRTNEEGLVWLSEKLFYASLRIYAPVPFVGYSDELRESLTVCWELLLMLYCCC